MMDPGRRLFLRGRAGREPEAAPRPPWALADDARFTQACTRCGDCVRACPTQVLRVASGGFPSIDFSHAGCTLCGACSQACATGAIGTANGTPAFPWVVQAGRACLAEQGVECRICGDACDARALRFVPRLGGVARCSVDTAACTGCGVCVSTCPVSALQMQRRESTR